MAGLLLAMSAIHQNQSRRTFHSRLTASILIFKNEYFYNLYVIQLQLVCHIEQPPKIEDNIQDTSLSQTITSHQSIFASLICQVKITSEVALYNYPETKPPHNGDFYLDF